jgi:ATP-dependent DNA helicase RecG
MVKTTNGFEIAEVDLELRGAGDLAGTQQSGTIDLKIADLIQDQSLLLVARQEASELVEQDPDFSSPENVPIKKYLEEVAKEMLVWTHIS